VRKSRSPKGAKIEGGAQGGSRVEDTAAGPEPRERQEGIETRGSRRGRRILLANKRNLEKRGDRQGKARMISRSTKINTKQGRERKRDGKLSLFSEEASEYRRVGASPKDGGRSETVDKNKHVLSFLGRSCEVSPRVTQAYKGGYREKKK